MVTQPIFPMDVPVPAGFSTTLVHGSGPAGAAAELVPQIQKMDQSVLP